MKKYLLTESRGDSPSESSIFSMSKERGETKLFFSSFGPWSSLCRGKLAASLKDDGSGVTLKFWKGVSVRLDYIQMETLVLMLAERPQGHKYTKWEKS